MFLFEENGRTHVCESGADVLKSLGVQNFARQVTMVDEQGMLIGHGQGGEGLLKSMPVISRLREEVLMKSQRQAERPLHKSQGGPFAGILRELEEMQRVQAARRSSFSH